MFFQFLQVSVLVLMAFQCHGLRHEWTNRPLRSKVAQELSFLNQKCDPSKPNFKTYALNNYGMGSSITCLIKATCNALNNDNAMRTLAASGINKWIWNDEEFCGQQAPPYDIKTTMNPLQCYFGNVFTPCLSLPTAAAAKATAVWWQQWKCPKFIPHVGNSSAVWDFSSATMEYLFSQVNPAIVTLAEQEARKIFGPNGAPAKMITVHIRWGDKKHEMGGSLVPIQQYVNAVKYFISKHHLVAGEINIFLTTEDPHAATLFKTHATVLQQKWNIFEYAAAVSSKKETHTPALDATDSKGKFGLISMIVLLLSMEAQYYVLTTASNWSALMQHLINSVVKHSGRDMDYIDLRRNPLGHKLQYAFNANQNLPKDYPYNSDGVLVFPIGSSIN